jgi:hypothetical protein
MPALSYYSNVFNTALAMLQRKGFRVWTEQDGNLVCAERDGWDFMADDPVQLLGLIAIYEAHQPAKHTEYWWKIDEPRLWDKIPSSRPDYVPVWERK